MKILILLISASASLAAQSWPAFSTTFGSFSSRPRTAGEAEAAGWILLDSCSDQFRAHRYGHPDDATVILMYDDAGFIAGTQSVVPQDKIDPSVMDVSRIPAYQPATWFDVPVYLTTMYFVDVNMICAGGRTQEQFDAQGTGDRLILQVGPVAYTYNLLSLPLTKTDAEADPTWYNHFCFLGMGDHFLQFNYQPDQDCNDVLPVQILYDDGYDGIVAGFVWQHMTYLDGDTWEHPDNMAVGAIIDRPPQCVWDVVESPGLSTMHHYFWDYPLLIGCF